MKTTITIDTNSKEYVALLRRCTIDVGDIVKCRPFVNGEMGYNNSACEYLQSITGVVTHRSDFVGYCVKDSISGRFFIVPFFAITLVKKDPTREAADDIIRRSDFLAFHKASGFKVGDAVLVVRKAENREMGWDCNWCREMDAYVGKIYTIKSNADERGWELINANDIYAFPDFVLQKVQNAFILESGVVVEVDADKNIHIGNNTLTKNDVKRILAMDKKGSVRKATRKKESANYFFGFFLT